MPQDMKGVINIRGAVIPVINVALKIGLSESVKTEDSRIVLLDLHYEGESLVIGMLSDKVNEVIDIQPDEIEPPPTLGNRVKEGFVDGVGKKGEKFILILNIEKLFFATQQEKE
jgi:purine-binding chemotaxis protein CheW